jgi:hypothetical protein
MFIMAYEQQIMMQSDDTHYNASFETNPLFIVPQQGYIGSSPITYSYPYFDPQLLLDYIIQIRFRTLLRMIHQFHH